MTILLTELGGMKYFNTSQNRLRNQNRVSNKDEFCNTNHKKAVTGLNSNMFQKRIQVCANVKQCLTEY